MASPLRSFSQLFILVVACIFLTSCTTPPAEIKARHDSGNAANGGSGTTMTGPTGNCPDGRDCRVCIPTTQIFVVPPSASALKVSSTPSAGGANVGPVTYVLKVVRDRLQASTQAIVSSMVNNADFKTSVVALMTLVIAFYAVFVIAGGASAHMSDILTVLTKIIIVFYVTTDYSVITQWTRDLGEIIVNDLSAAFLTSVSTLSTTNTTAAELEVTGMMDRFINLFLSMEFFEFLLAMAFHGLVGFSYVIMLCFMFFVYVASVIKVTYYLILAMVMRYFLYAVAPIFILGLMFRQTRSFFDNWVGQLVNFIIQAVMLVAFVSIIHMMLIGIMEFMARSLAPQLCYMPWLSIPAPSQLVGSDNWYNFYRFQLVDANGMSVVTHTPMPGVQGSAMDYLTDLIVVAIGCFMCIFMFMFTTFIQEASRHLAGGGVMVGKGALDGMVAGVAGAATGGAMLGGKGGAKALMNGDILGAVGSVGSGFGKGFSSGMRSNIAGTFGVGKK